MEKVLSDEEPLEILRDNSFSKDLIEKRQSFGEEVQMLRAQNEINYSPTVKDSASDYINKHVDKVIESKSLFKYSYSLDTKPQPKSKKSTFKAGSRAVIEVEGELTSSQEEQLRSITSLVRSILKEK
jgi:hypothetical protein